MTAKIALKGLKYMTTSKEYGKMTKNASPPSPKIKNIINAFWTGGLICTIGQALNVLYTATGFSDEEVKAGVSVTLIVAAACLTGLGIYDKIAKVAGAGTIVPITGFANSIVSPAMEFSAEGRILGTGAKLFSLAGPVIAYGTLAAFIYGIICYCFKLY